MVDLPPGRKALGGKWVYTHKKNDDGTDGAYKAHWVGKGYTQVAGVDFFDTYSPVARSSTLRILLALAVQYDLDIRQLDVPVAYLNGEMDEEIYMIQPQGYETGNKVARLMKGLYGTKQAGRKWNKKFHATLIEDGFIQARSDQCLYYKGSIKDLRSFAMILVYVDDVLVVASKEGQHLMKSVIATLVDKFNIKDLGWVSRYLGMTVKRSDGKLIQVE